MADNEPEDRPPTASGRVKEVMFVDSIPIQKTNTSNKVGTKDRAFSHNIRFTSTKDQRPMPMKTQRQPFNPKEIIDDEITDENSRSKDAIFDWTVCTATIYDNLSVVIYDKISIGDDEDANTRPNTDDKPIPGDDHIPREDAKYQSDDQYHRPDACVYPRREKIGNYSNRDCVKLSKPEFVHRLTNIQNKYKNI
jgi:hypothetical protein